MDKKEQNFTPNWSKSITCWCQIFPEKFRNGDTTNDPKLNDIKGAYPFDASEPWTIHQRSRYVGF